MSQEKMEFDDEVDQMESRLHTCANIILELDLPFDLFEHVGMRRYTESLNPNAVIPPKNVIEAYVTHLYTKEKSKLKQELATIPNRISLSFDLWESCTSMPYICLTAHFVDADWKLNSKVLNFCSVYPPTGGEVCETMIELLNDWGIEKKIFSLTLDHSFENNVLQEQLKNHLGLQNGLLCDGEFFHARCFARVLNLIVEEGLKLVSDAVCKIRESIIFVRHSKSRRENFKACVEKVGGVDGSVRLHLDSSMSVNSTYAMLESALKYQDEDEVMKGMAERMMSKFERYWDEYSVVLALGAVLDPRMKLSTLAYCYSKLDASTCERKLQQVKSKLYMLFDKYCSKSTSYGLQGTIQDQSLPLQKKLKSSSHGLFDELKVHHQQLVTETGKSQLDVYLDESNLDFRCYEDMDVLQWWKSNNNRFPDLSILACDLLSVPIATVASDYEFCMGSRVFNKYKDLMLLVNIETRICTRSWLHNFVSHDDEDEDDDDDDFEEKMNEI
ncbi:hypothetical protein TSUD_78400 [Trifolium subterraneum]|uniref:HAT C-terminal dimerisation domain-containing protein n=1 Tax=Trifolium subterraneum TaxID=3900 RepID=A0A2Z6MUA2_TRISU|nr:hypothetical protein TSUD_78400 [Trifolium subterraneum]